MMRLMRADMYRIFRGKAIYITFAIMLILIVLTVFVFRSAIQTVVIAPIEELDISLETPMEVIEHIMPSEEIMSGSVAARLALNSMDSIAYYFFLPIIVAVAMAAFSSGAIKNELAIGISRTRLYLSKWILSSALCFVFMLLYLLLSVLFATTIDGIGYWDSGYLANTLKSFGMQTFFMLAINSVGIFLCFATKKTAAVIGAFIAIVLVPLMIVSLLVLAFPGAMEYTNYDLVYQLIIFAQTASLSGTAFARGVAIGLAYLLIPTIGGIMLFRKAEIK